MKIFITVLLVFLPTVAFSDYFALDRDELRRTLQHEIGSTYSSSTKWFTYYGTGVGTYEQGTVEPWLLKTVNVRVQGSVGLSLPATVKLKFVPEIELEFGKIN